jgi:hypothetical protein
VSDLSIEASAVSLSETTELAFKLSWKLSSAELDRESESLGLSQLTTTTCGWSLRASDSDRESLYSMLRDEELESESTSLVYTECGSLSVKPAELTTTRDSESERV